MTFDDIAGNSVLINRLKHTVSTGSVSHAYIFTGGNTDYRRNFARAFVLQILCDRGGCGNCRICRLVASENHPDVLTVEPEKGHRLLDEQIESMQVFLMSRPVEGDAHICIIDRADTMTERAQNRILKTLEEPSGNTVILLLADNTESFLQTVLSRCVLCRLEGSDMVPSDEAAQMAQKLEDMMYTGEAFFRLKAFADEISKDKDTAVQVLDSLQIMYRDMLLSGSRRYSPEKVIENVDTVEETKKRIGRNVKISSALKYMILKIGG